MINKIYEILLTHNRTLTLRELIFFVIILSVANLIFYILLKKNKIKKVQIITGELLLLFIFVVLSSTVLIRIPGEERLYKLVLFWSWQEVIRGDMELLEENLLNLIFLFPFGFLLPFAFYLKTPRRLPPL